MTKFLDKLKNKKMLLLLLTLIVAGVLWKLYPRMLVPRMFPSDEYINIGYVLWLVNHGGNPYDAFHNPHLGYFLIYFIYLVSRINVHQIMFTINPIISGLTVIPFFFFSIKILNNKNQALVASILYTFSETVFYRTCHYGSNEALGLFLMFVYLAMYLRADNPRKKVLSILFLIPIPFAHVLPFIFVIAFTVLDLFLKKRKVVVIGLIIIGIIVIFNPAYPPHRFVANVFVSKLSAFSLDKIFLFDPTEILSVTPFLMGLIAMFLLSIFSYKKSSKLERGTFLLILFAIPVSLFLYDARLIGPTRLLVYLVIPLFTMTARLLEKKKLAVSIIVLLMIISPLIGGTNKFVWVSDSITQNEIDAIEYLGQNGFFDVYDSTYWYGDAPVKQYLATYWGGSMIYVTTPGYFTYIFLSERMEKRGFFLKLQDGGRTIEIREPVYDVWAINQSGWKDEYLDYGVNLYGWKLLYNINGVKVYEAIWD